MSTSPRAKEPLRLLARLVHALPAVLLVACLQSVHEDGPSGPPSWSGKARVLEERPQWGRTILGGDQVRVDLKGTYANGEVWGEGPYTFIAGSGSYPGAMHPPTVGTTIRMQYLTTPNDSTMRLWPVQGLDPENEVYLVRRDRGPIIVEHRIRSVCRPYKLSLLNTGKGAIEPEVGCWPVLRPPSFPTDPKRTEFERRVAEINSGIDNPAPDGKIFDPPPAPRAPADTSAYLDAEGLHRAASEGRAEIVGWLIRRGVNPAAPDSFGFQAIHHAAMVVTFQRFVEAFDQEYVAVVDTLLAHDVPVDAPVRAGKARGVTSSGHEHEGKTALTFAAPECNDRLVRRLLERGANPNAYQGYETSPLAGAAINGCREVVQMLLEHGVAADYDPGGGTALQRLCAAGVFYQGVHLEIARLLVKAGVSTRVAAERLKDRLDDPGPGGFGFRNRREARRILQLLRASPR